MPPHQLFLSWGMGLGLHKCRAGAHQPQHLCLQVDPSPLKVAVQHLRDEPYDSDDDVLKATVMEIVQTMKELVAQNPLYREQMQAS